MYYESDSNTSCDQCTWNDPKRLGKGISKTTNNNSIIKIDQNTEKSSGDLRKLTVAQILEKHHQLTLV